VREINALVFTHTGIKFGNLHSVTTSSVHVVIGERAKRTRHYQV